jgi:hypothetical protein
LGDAAITQWLIDTYAYWKKSLAPSLAAGVGPQLVFGRLWCQQ